MEGVRRIRHGMGVVAMMALLVAGAASAQSPSPPPYPHPWNQPGCPCPEVLHQGSPADAGLVPQALDRIGGTISRALVRRVFPGAVLLVARRGVIADWKAYGYASIYVNGDYATVAHPLPMPPGEMHPTSMADMQKDEIFDLASVTKMFTATAVMQLWDEGKFKLDDPVAKYLPGFGVHGKEDVTIRELLTHTSGFEPDPPTPLYDIKGTRAQRLQYVEQLSLEHPPGTHYLYSDINYIMLGALVEKVSGEREDVFLRKHLTGPLHMTDTMFNPPPGLRPRIAASEYQPWLYRGMLRGEVEDGNSWALGGVAGHAGLFSSAHDLAVFGQMMLNGGTYDGVRVLSERAVKLMLTNQDAKLGAGNGLGWWVGMPGLTGALAGPHTAGHEGYTGTMLAINTRNDIVAILLTNRVHPTRNGPSVVPAIRAVYTDIANAIPVAAPDGKPAWFAGYGDYLNRALTAEVTPHPGAMLSFQTWYRIQPDDDYGNVEASPDGVHWKSLERLTGSSDGWQTKNVELPADTRYVQFRYQTDEEINGRGWYVTDIRTQAGGTTTQPKITEKAWQQRAY